MKREILFRGQSVGSSAWLYGYLNELWTAKGTDALYTIDNMDERNSDGDSLSVCPVFTCTIGQYTGRKDKDGVKIFGGDIISVNGKHLKTVEYDDDRMSFCLINISDMKYADWMDIKQVPGIGWWNDFKREILIVGNISDNPEMLKS